MTFRFIIILLSMVLFTGVSSVKAEISSTNFRIPMSVLSGGGGYTSSTNFQSENTLAQPAPLIDIQDPPFSDNYDLYPGFWYTIAYWEIPKRSISLPLILLLLNEQ